jgi:hypothetical protein
MSGRVVQVRGPQRAIVARWGEGHDFCAIGWGVEGPAFAFCFVSGRGFNRATIPSARFIESIHAAKPRSNPYYLSYPRLSRR